MEACAGVVAAERERIDSFKIYFQVDVTEIGDGLSIFFRSHLFIYLYKHGLKCIYFILWMIIQYECHFAVQITLALVTRNLFRSSLGFF